MNISVEAAFFLLLAALCLLQRTRLAGLPNHPGRCMALLFALPVVLRLLLLFRYPIPAPYVSDDFVQILSADTLLHLRLANPAHPFHRFFETFFTLQEPTYSTMFPLGQGLILALGKLLTGSYWAGVVLSIGALSALVYWMLLGWVSPGWALAGGLLAAMQFGPLCEWMNSYWGGAVSACAGCLVFGALPRIHGRPSPRNVFLLGTGLALHLITRPFESLFLFGSAAVFLAYNRPRKLFFATPPLAAAAVLILFQNHAVTGSWTTLPYQLSQYQYGVPTTMTFQPNPEPHRSLTREQQLVVEIQRQRHGEAETPATYFQRLAYRLRYLRFFLLAPLYIALPFFFPALRQLRYFWVLGTIVLFALGSNFYPYFYPHYIAGITCLILLVTVAGLERLSRIHAPAAFWLVRLSAAHFLFWYGILAFATPQILDAMKPYATWHVINIGDPEGRNAIRAQLEAQPGRQLVFVRYWALHTFREWVHNEADIDGSRIVWARDLGPNENARLRDHYPDRKAWLLEPDANPPRLRPYEEAAATRPSQSPPYSPSESQNGSH